ncbi:hypothetical protein [Alicyclobacillus sendaiensis]|uniref:hypothetical protein n=1 Tax=Alicyclobacillus sendaiensis TaxID=192387 RepID=UPI000780F356|nr:hypothetical protein [Alicyclobacillus sendaiensis]
MREPMATRANMVQVVQILHDPSSAFLDMLLHALHKGKLCIVDVSQVRGSQALVLSGIVLQRIFEHNQRHFTEKDAKTIPPSRWSKKPSPSSARRRTRRVKGRTSPG